MVYLKNGSIIHGIVIEQVPNISVKIKTHDNNVFFYKIDEIEKLTKEQLSLISTPKISNIKPSEMYANGIEDGRNTFRTGGVFPGTFFTTITAGPLFGLIPACVFSRHNIDDYKLRFGNKDFLENANYKEGYLKAARHKKRATAWGAWGLGTGLDIIASVLVSVYTRHR